jgi:hypothetical protein
LFNGNRYTMLRLISLTAFLSASIMIQHCNAPDHSTILADDPVPIPEMKAWEENMKTFGMKHTNERTFSILDEPGPERYVWYYDGPRVLYQIADYTGDTTWKDHAEKVQMIYREYIYALNGKVPGWRIFPHGLSLHYKVTGDGKSKEAAVLLSERSAFASAGGGPDERLSRETAYCINAYITAEALGQPTHPKLEQALEFALGHIEQWFVQNTSENWAPFMFGLTCEALISYYSEVKKDPRILPAIKLGLDECWERAWKEDKQAFFYRADNPAGAAPDLNLLVAPAYAWVYLLTGDTTYRDRGDKIFAGGVRGANLNGGKQFSQNYRWSFNYVKWRTEAERIRTGG